MGTLSLFVGVRSSAQPIAGSALVSERRQNVVRKSLQSLAIIALLLGTIGFGSSARAAGPTSATVTITASVADVLILSVNTNSFTFGNNLNFLGQNAARGACPLAPAGYRYLSPDVTTTVMSNRNYDVQRTATGSF